jgi:hypothetical protein
MSAPETGALSRPNCGHPLPQWRKTHFSKLFCAKNGFKWLDFGAVVLKAVPQKPPLTKKMGRF